MNPTKLILIILICFTTLFFLNGCIEMSRSEVNACLKLAGQSYAFIPACTTESSCFNKVSEIFKTNFFYGDESELYTLKNHVARSWYFYNKAIKEQKNIQTACTNKNPLTAAGAINQTQLLIENSFDELDLGLKKSFEFISKKEEALTKEDIDLIKEEKIYSNLVELRQILSELSTGATNSDTYVSYYSKKAKEFARTSAAKGFHLLVEKRPFWLEHFDTINDTILKELKIEKKAQFPFIGDFIPFLILQAEKIFYKKESLIALQNFPVYEFMKLYSDLGGNNNSALKRFADLVNKISENEKELNTKINNSWKKNDALIKELNEKLLKEEQILEFKNLAEKLFGKTINTNTNQKNIIEEIKKNYIKLKEKKSLNNLTKGKELSELNYFELELEKIIENINFNQTGFNEKLITTCKEKANEKINTQKTEEQEIIKIIEDIKYYSSRVKNTTGRECLLLCEELINKKEELEIFTNNQLLFEELKKEAAKECLLALEKIFLTEHLFELKTEFEELKKREINKNNLTEFSQDCENLKERVEKNLSNETIFEKILEEYLLATKQISLFEKISFYINEKTLTNTFENNKQKIINLEEYFINKKINFEKLSPIKETIYSKLLEINNNLKNLIKENTIKYVQNNLVIKTISEGPLIVGEQNFVKNFLIIENPFEPMNEEFYLISPIELKEIEEQDTSIEYIDGKKIKLSYLPKGKILVAFFTELLIKQYEEDKLEYVSNELSLLRRKITLEPKIDSKNILIKTTKPLNTVITLVLINENEIIHSTKENNTLFNLEEINKETNINVDYYFSDGIKINKELLEIKQTDLDETLIYKIEAKNNLSKNIKATLSISFPTTNAEIIIYSQDYTKKEFKKIGDKVVLQNQQFKENEIKYYEAWIKTSNALDYYIEGLMKQKEFFEKHNQEEKANITQNAIKSEKIDLMKKVFESNETEITKILLNEKEKEATTLMKEKLLEKIEELRKKEEELYKMGLVTQAEKIGSTINTIINEKLDDEKSIAKAFDTLINLSFNSDNKIKSEVEKMWNKINSGELNEELILLKNKFFDNKISFEEEFMIDPIKTNKIFLELKKDYEEFEKIRKELEKTKTNEDKNLEKNYLKKIEYCFSNLTYFENILLTQGTELLKSKFLFPLPQQRIDKLKLIINEINNSNKTNYEKLNELEPIYDEIYLANESIKKQAIKMFNDSIDNKTSKEILSEGKDLIDNNKFIDAYLLLFNPSQSFPTPNLTYFIPIFLIIVVALILKTNLNKKNKIEEEKRKKISEEWDSL